MLATILSLVCPHPQLAARPTLPPNANPYSPSVVRAVVVPFEQDVKIDDGVSPPSPPAQPADLRTADRPSDFQAKIQKLSSSLFVISSNPLCPPLLPPFLARGVIYQWRLR